MNAQAYDPKLKQTSVPYRLARLRLWERDGVRLLLDLVRWNWAKARWVGRGRPEPCPCHDPSDSGQAGWTRCLPAEDWNDPHRFQRVCPLLRKTEAGWCCSVGTAGVRPFWGRALMIWALVGLLVYLGGTVGAWGAFRVAGYRTVQWADVASPWSWRKFRLVQSARFRADGYEAIRRGDFNRALLALAIAQRFREGDYLTARTLTKLWSRTDADPDRDAIIDRALGEFPPLPEDTAMALHDMLLAAGRYRVLVDLCLERLAAESRFRSWWERSLYFAAEQGRQAGYLGTQRATRVQGLSAEAQRLLTALACEQEGKREHALGRLEVRFPPAASPVAMRQQIEWLTRWGKPDEAAILVQHYLPAIGSFEAAALTFWISWSKGDRATAEADLLSLLRAPLQPAQADRLAALVIESGEGRALRRLPEYKDTADLKNDTLARAALWVAGLSSGEIEWARQQARLAREQLGTEWPDIPRIDFGERGPGQVTSLGYVLGVVALPRETVYALLRRR